MDTKVDGMADIPEEEDAKQGPIDHARIERAVREILIAVGEDPDREGLKDTPKRVARMYAEVFAGLYDDAARVRPDLLHRAVRRDWSSCATSPSTPSASTTCCPSKARPTSPTCPTAGSSACPSSPASSMPSPAGRRSRSG